MHGNLLELAVSVGDSVTEGQLLAVMEAMKMEHRLQAEVAGTISAVHVSAGQQIAAGELILEIDDE
jgi:geranyl-CoA carboxylase alpha subunit